MFINKIGSVEISSKPTKQNDYKNGESKDGQVAGTPVASDTVSIKSSALADIGRQYDVTNMSPRDMKDMSKKLFDKGLISGMEYGVLAFQPEVDDPYYNERNGKSANLVAQPDLPRNFLEQLEGNAKRQMQEGADVKTMQYANNLVSILKNVQTAHDSLSSKD